MTQQWTEAQQRAISTVGRSLLVSAAAGSGKTSVLAERCAHLVCDAPPAFRCDVTELLVVTFTEAAAAEMRSRIAGALFKRYQQSDDQRLAHQLALIDRAQISTIHSFCMNVLRQNFHVLGLDPNFEIISEEEGVLLRSEIARELFAHHYETDESAAFARLIDRYGDGKDESLRQRVIGIHALLGSLVDPQAWIDKSRARLLDAAEKPMTESAMGRAVLRRVQSQLKFLVERLVRLMGQFHAAPRLEKYEDYTGELLATAQSWKDAFAARGIDGLAEQVKAVSFERLLPVSNLTPAEEGLKIEMLSIRETLSKGDLFKLCRFSESEWRDGMRATIEPANLMLDLVNEFGGRYRAAKDQQRVLDFNDLEQLALQVLRSDAAVAREYRRQFKHVLVDEYQDVNELQDTILTLVSRETNEDGHAPNFFCVGDVKQSIYRFRLAEPQRFLKRNELFRASGSAGSVIDLQTNFRSRGPLLDTLNGIFGRLMTTDSAELLYDESHHLRAPDDSPYLASATDVPHAELHLLPKSAEVEGEQENEGGIELDQSEREAAFIAARIAQLTGADGQPPLQIFAKSETGELEQRAARLGDIAILLRSMKYKAEHFADILRGHGIAVHCDSSGGFFAATEVQDVLALLKVLDNQQQDIPLAALLRSPIAAIARPEDALAAIRLAFRQAPFHQAVALYARERQDELATHLRGFLKQIAQWRELAHRRPLAEVLWLIYDQSGYLAFVEGLDDGAQRVANLLALHEHARKFGTFRRQGLGRFMRFLDTLRDEIDDLGQPSVASAADDAVRIMSVHRSKGLEFPIVFVPDLGKRHNLSDSRGHILVEREAGIGLIVCDEHKRIRYPSLASTIVSERLRKQSLAEEMRVLYVATTRARERLILVGTCATDANQKWSQRWAGHDGALPADDVLRGNCMLDWIGPALACMRTGADGASFEVTTHESLPSETPTFQRRTQLNEQQRAIAELKPVAADLSIEAREAASALWTRLTEPYHHAKLMNVHASRAVTAIAHENTPPGSTKRTRDESSAIMRSLRRPRAGVASLAPGAIDIGAATHLLLQHLHLDLARDGEDLRRQLEELIARRIVSERVSTAIDLTAIDWFMNQTELGAMLRKHAASVLREVPINFPLEAACDAPLDRVMVRGRIDLLLPIPLQGPRRALIVDFKTDLLSEEIETDPRHQAYQRQLDVYAQAIREMLGCKNIETHIVYLKPRRILTR